MFFQFFHFVRIFQSWTMRGLVGCVHWGNKSLLRKFPSLANEILWLSHFECQRLLLLVLRPLHSSGSRDPTGALLLHTPHTQSDQVSHGRPSDVFFHKAIYSWCSPVAVAGTVTFLSSLSSPLPVVTFKNRNSILQVRTLMTVFAGFDIH